jgi:hypothetical protein
MKKPIVISLFMSVAVMVTFISCANESDKSSMKSDTEISGQLFMDTHKNVEGLTAEAVMGAHKRDLEVQEKYGVKYIDYWYEEENGTVFCLVEAPNAEAAAQVHKEAHGLVADEIVAVSQGI